MPGGALLASRWTTAKRHVRSGVFVFVCLCGSLAVVAHLRTQGSFAAGSVGGIRESFLATKAPAGCC